METKNHLGLDKFQVTIITGNYNSLKPSLKKVEAAQAKINAAKEKYEKAVEGIQQEIAAYREQIDMLDQFAINTTTKSCGIGLTTEQVVKFMNAPQAFEEYKQSIGMGDMFASESQQEENSIIAA